MQIASLLKCFHFNRHLLSPFTPCLSFYTFHSSTLVLYNCLTQAIKEGHKWLLKFTAMARLDRDKNLETLMDLDKPGTARNDKQLRPQKSIPGYGLEFSNLSYSVIKRQKKDGVWIKKEAYLLHDISGQAIKGEIMAIMGPSGAGKSTFLDALAGRIAKGSLQGSVRIDGKPVKMINSYFMFCAGFK